MNAERSGQMILAIAVSDDFLRVYGNDRDFLADSRFLVAAGKRFGALEFFDSKGYRLVGKYDHRWRLLCLTRTAECNEKLVIQRIQTSLKNLRCYIESHPGKFENNGTIDDALALVPDLDESSDLATAMQRLSDHFNQLDGPPPAVGLRRLLPMAQRRGGGFKCRWCCASGMCRCC